MTPFATFRVLSLNARGFSGLKVDLFFDRIQRHYDFGFIQESLISDENVFESLASRWSGPCFWSPAIGKQGGVLVFVSENFEGKITTWRRDSNGRVLSLLVSHMGINYNLVNIYAPTDASARADFFRSLHGYFLPHSTPIIGGDFNCYDNALDKFGGNVNLFKELTTFKSCFQLSDAWRQKHPRATQCSWFNSDLSIGSRLDTFVIPRAFVPTVQRCEISPCALSDHDFVDISFNLSDSPEYGPGVWKINNSLLLDESFCSMMRDLIDRHLEFKHVFITPQIFWEELKTSIRYETIKFSKAKRRELSREQVSITNRLIILKQLLVQGDLSVREEIKILESSLSTLFTREFEGVKIRSRAKWLEEGEVPSSYFFKLQQEKRSKNLISSILNSENIEVSPQQELEKAHVDFYSALFSREDINMQTQSFLFSQVTRKLSQADRDLCEGDLLLSEATTAAKEMNKNKTPGPDGLSAEFYLTFWQRLGPVLVEIFNSCLENSELCESMKTSATRLVFKKGDKNNLKNWRPISLLNVDYKICSKALSCRLAKVLDVIVDPDQTCSVPGRSIASNLMLLRDSLDYINITNETGILVSLDQEKAFDRVDRSFLMNLLQHFGFGPSFCNWISTLYNGANMQIIVNGFLTDKIDIQRGVRQGDSLSPMLYVLCVEVLACLVRNCADIEGFLLPGAKGRQFKISSYADDMTSLVKNPRSLHYLFQAVSLYEQGSGAKLNLSKCEAMWLGAWRDCEDQPLGLTWVKKMKVLGVFFGTSDVERDNWNARLDKLEKSLNLWKTRSLSMVGKALIINVLGISKLLYIARVLIPPKWVFDRFNKLVWPFLWGSKIETVARKTLHCDISKGGLGIIDLEVKCRALRIALVISSLEQRESKVYCLLKYFCGSKLAGIKPDWAHLRDNLTPTAAAPTKFYSACCKSLEKFSNTFLTSASSSKAIYSEIRKEKSSPPILPWFWGQMVGPGFVLEDHWSKVRHPLSENYLNDLVWLITLRGVKIRDSMRNWGYIPSDRCAVCNRKETIDHCFLNCKRAKSVWTHFSPVISDLLSLPTFSANVLSVFFFRWRLVNLKENNIAIFLIKNILYAIWKLRNKATFHNGGESASALIKYAKQQVTRRVRLDFFRLPREKFSATWLSASFCVINAGTLLFCF